MKVKQIILPIEKYFIYKTQIQRYKQALKWELISSGESENAVLIRQQIAINEENIGKLLDMEI